MFSTVLNNIICILIPLKEHLYKYLDSYHKPHYNKHKRIERRIIENGKLSVSVRIEWGEAKRTNWVI